MFGLTRVCMLLLSTIYLMSSPAAFVQLADPALAQAVEVVRRHNLETVPGRTAFLTGELTPFVQDADQLNHEIQALAVQIASQEEGSPENPLPKAEIVAMGEDLNQKMGRMIEMLPNLQAALLIDQDFQKIDEVLAKQGPLEPSERELLIRISSLCVYLDARNNPQPVEHNL